MYSLSSLYKWERDFLKLAVNDKLGRKLRAAGLRVKQRAPKKINGLTLTLMLFKDKIIDIYSIIL